MSYSCYKTLKQNRFWGYQNHNMCSKFYKIHFNSQFTWNITIRYVLQRFETLGIHRTDLYKINLDIYPIYIFLFIFMLFLFLYALDRRRSNDLNDPKYYFLSFYKCVNDPPAGSPTGTLLRLLLPSNYKIRTNFIKMLLLHITNKLLYILPIFPTS
jgi:hypothetical protein